MKVTNLKNLNLSNLINTGDPIIVIGVREGYSYNDGKRMDVSDHTKVEVVLPTCAYEKLTVKVLQTAVTNEEIAKKGGSIKVKFNNFTAKIYRAQNGDYALSCNADTMEVIL